MFRKLAFAGTISLALASLAWAANAPTYQDPVGQTRDALGVVLVDTTGAPYKAATTGGGAVTQSGTWTVQPGNTANTTPWLVTLQPTTSGGSSTYSGNVTTAGSGAGTGGVAVDASPGQVYGYAVYNGNSTVCYLGLYDQTQALTNLGTTTPKLAIGIPANGGANLALPNGIPFATAITVSATTTRAGSTGCSTGLDINIWYK
jgi:hypothetical protein